MTKFPHEDFHEVWWIYSPERHAWGGLHLAHFRKSIQGNLLVLILGEVDHRRVGLRVWDDITEREGWVQVKQIKIPTNDEITMAIDAKMREIAQDVMREAGIEQPKDHP